MKKYAISLFCILLTFSAFAQHKIERLDRGLYACRRHADDGNFISWRIYGTEWEDGAPTVSFNVYRDETLLTSEPITVSNYFDEGADAGATYTVKTVKNDIETEEFSAEAWTSPWWGIPVDIPDGGTSPDDVDYTYSPNDMSVGDVDGDGQLEYILKWNPSNAKDNSNSGYAGNVYLDCYEFDGTQLWRIDLGVNIRAGAHYTQFIVYDLDSDGKAEVACKTAPGTIDGTGSYLSSGSAASDDDSEDYRNSSGYILDGPEYLTVFSGQTGEELATVDYVVERGTVDDWGDSYGNRVDRFNAAVAYLDGKNPSLIMCRGYYTRTAIAAWDWDGSDLTQRWLFDTGNDESNEYYGQGNHNLAIGDLDDDGYDEIQFGSMAVDHDGSGLYSTGYGHGDAGHLTDMDPTVDGLEYFMPHEESPYGCHLINTKSQTVLFSTTSSGDNGRGVCYDVDEDNFGYECWSYDGNGMTDIYGNVLHSTLPTTAGGGATYNFGVWWDGDLMRELLDKTVITKYVASEETTSRTWSIYSDLSVSMNNGTKSNPCLSGDILGDWREEIILRGSSDDYIYILPTTTETDYNYYTLLHDVQYREAIAWQNSGYNQPPHPSFYLGTDMDAPPTPDIEYTTDCAGIAGGTAYYDECGDCVGGTTGLTACYVDCNGDIDGTAVLDDCGICTGGNTGNVACSSSMQGEDFCSADGVTEATNEGFAGDGYVNFDNSLSSSGTWYIYADATDTYTIGVRYANGGTTARGMTVYVDGTSQATLYAEATDDWTTYITEDISLTLVEGVNAIELIATTDNGGPNIDLFAFYDDVLHAGSCTTDCSGLLGGSAYYDNCDECVGGNTGLEACEQITAEAEETVCSYTGTIDSNNEGFSGTGFINTENAEGTTVTFNIYAEEATTVTFGIQCANGSTDRPAQILVNGTEAVASLSMITDSWTDYQSVETSLDLDAGVNEISLVALDAGGFGSLDYFYIYGDAEFAGCETTQSIALIAGWNLVSLYVIPGSSQTDSVFPNASEIKTLDEYYNTSQDDFLNTLADIEAGTGYLVYNTVAETITIIGVETGYTLSLQNGLNLIGCPYSESATFEDAFGTMLDSIQEIRSFDGEWTQDDTQTIDSLEPGKAYFIIYVK